MGRESKYPHAIDIREAISIQDVAGRAGVTAERARVIVDALIFGTRVIEASGATVFLETSYIWAPPDSAAGTFIKANRHMLMDAMLDGQDLAQVVADKMPADSPAPRYDPVREASLTPLAEDMARCRLSDVTSDEVDQTLLAWWDLEIELMLRPDKPEVVVRRIVDVLERDFEDWLAPNLGAVMGSEVRLIKRQWHTPSGGIADLVASVAPEEDPFWPDAEFIVIENKGGQAVPNAIHQVVRYADEAAKFFGGRVVPVVAAEGIGDRADALAEELGVVTLSWGELGYYDHLWCPDCAEQPIATFLSVFNEDSPFSRSSLPVMS